MWKPCATPTPCSENACASLATITDGASLALCRECVASAARAIGAADGRAYAARRQRWALTEEPSR